MKTLQAKRDNAMARWPGMQTMGHGEAFAQRGQIPRASRDGRSIEEGTWYKQFGQQPAAQPTPSPSQPAANQVAGATQAEPRRPLSLVAHAGMTQTAPPASLVPPAILDDAQPKQSNPLMQDETPNGSAMGFEPSPSPGPAVPALVNMASSRIGSPMGLGAPRPTGPAAGSFRSAQEAGISQSSQPSPYGGSKGPAAGSFRAAQEMPTPGDSIKSPTQIANPLMGPHFDPYSPQNSFWSGQGFNEFSGFGSGGGVSGGMPGMSFDFGSIF
jgi:hypothetical protein